MVLPSGLFALAFVALGTLATYFIFRRAAGSTIVHRIPVFLTCAVPLLYIGIASAPFTFEPLFTRVIGHNIRDVYHFPKRPDGLEFSESWWLARWQEPIQSVVFVLVAIGMVWALVNAARNRERKANLVGLATGLGLVVLSVFLTATFGLFF
jgi:hypothetical protein